MAAVADYFASRDVGGRHRLGLGVSAGMAIAASDGCDGCMVHLLLLPHGDRGMAGIALGRSARGNVIAGFA